jgi:hypothetical protein
MARTTRQSPNLSYEDEGENRLGYRPSRFWPVCVRRGRFDREQRCRRVVGPPSRLGQPNHRGSEVVPPTPGPAGVPRMTGTLSDNAHPAECA